MAKNARGLPHESFIGHLERRWIGNTTQSSLSCQLIDLRCAGDSKMNRNHKAFKKWTIFWLTAGLVIACGPAMVPYEQTTVPVVSPPGSTPTQSRAGAATITPGRQVSQSSVQLGAGPYQDLQITGKPDDLYAASIRVFLRRGLGFHSRDPIARAMETDWLVVKKARPFVRGIDASFRVIISKNRIEIYTSCIITTMDRLTNRKCPESDRPEEIERIEKELIREIRDEVAAL